MYIDLREFDFAKKLMAGTNYNVKDLMTKQADWAVHTNDPHGAW